MNKSEIAKFFSGKKWKGTLHEYKAGHGRVINYLHAGDENLPLVVFVHGSPGSLSAFIHFMDDSVLLKRAQVISVDRAGFGSSNFGYGEKSLQKQALYLKPILEKYKSNKPVILAGHSLGGPVIARMAMDYPELIDGLVIVAGSINPDLEPNETWFRAPLATPFLNWILPRSFRASNFEIYKLKPELQEMLPLWKKIICPVVVIQGNKDNLVSPKNADFARKMLTNSSSVNFVIQEDMNHFVPWEHPELIRDAILKLLAK
ncbi:MAG: alpha/beta hydrolase [Bacteroidetes bacterium]|nr:alpha/beta hydrolase [Bacteroidota bacterium]